MTNVVESASAKSWEMPVIFRVFLQDGIGFAINANPELIKSARKTLGKTVTKQIQVSNDVYAALCAIAEARGRSIKPGRGSGMVATLREMTELFKPIQCGDMSESWARFNARIMPALNSLALEATRHHERVDISFSVSRGLHLKRVIEHPTPPPQPKPSKDGSTAILEGRKVEERR